MTHPTQTPKQKGWRIWIRALTNPHLLLCLAISWFLTNGWAYCFLGIGICFDIGWMRSTASVYLGLLWFPGTPEKLITFAIAILLLRLWFPKDERTLAFLKQKQQLLWTSIKQKYHRFIAWKNRRRTKH